MSVFEGKTRVLTARLLNAAAAIAVVLALSQTSLARIPGVEGTSFSLTAAPGYIAMPDGASIYSWGYGVGGSMQLPGPTLIVNQNDVVTIELTNNLPLAAGNTSIVIPGLAVTASGGVAGVLTQEAQTGGTVTYSFTASQPGTYMYHSGTRADLQVEMGLYGTIVVRPSNPACAYNLPQSCFDREYLFVLSEIQVEVHQAVEAQASGRGPIDVALEPYRPEYWMINGRSAPATMEEPNSGVMPHQPYNSNPHMLPGEKILLRVVGAGREQHPFHTHGNHVRVLARDGQLLLGPTGQPQAKLEFSIPSIPGQTVDGIFEWTGAGLGWDIYGHNGAPPLTDTNSDGYDDVTQEWVEDHNKAIPVTLPGVNVTLLGPWYSGSPYMGDLAQLPPGQGGLNPNAGFIFMWHSHTERELTYGNVFPGGMMTMMIVEPPGTAIDETK